jgi:hypothetical protein
MQLARNLVIFPEIQLEMYRSCTERAGVRRFCSPSRDVAFARSFVPSIAGRSFKFHERGYSKLNCPLHSEVSGGLTKAIRSFAFRI